MYDGMDLADFPKIKIFMLKAGFNQTCLTETGMKVDEETLYDILRR